MRFQPSVGMMSRPHARLELGAVRRRSSTSWKPGSLFGQRAHVAAALDVVLSAERIAPAPVAPDVSGEQREVDQRQDVVDGVVVLGDAERPADHRAIGFRVRVRGVADDVGGNSRDALARSSSVYGSTASRYASIVASCRA